jgi:hypothetical protein
MSELVTKREVDVVEIRPGRYRTSTGQPSLSALMDHFLSTYGSGKWMKAEDIARFQWHRKKKSNAKNARRYIGLLRNECEDRGHLAVVEFKDRQLWAIKLYDASLEYDQQLMAAERARRVLRKDGSEAKLDNLIRLLPSKCEAA